MAFTAFIVLSLKSPQWAVSKISSSRTACWPAVLITWCRFCQFFESLTQSFMSSVIFANLEHPVSAYLQTYFHRKGHTQVLFYRKQFFPISGDACFYRNLSQFYNKETAKRYKETLVLKKTVKMIMTIDHFKGLSMTTPNDENARSWVQKYFLRSGWTPAAQLIFECVCVCVCVCVCHLDSSHTTAPKTKAPPPWITISTFCGSVGSSGRPQVNQMKCCSIWLRCHPFIRFLKNLCE